MLLCPCIFHLHCQLLVACQVLGMQIKQQDVLDVIAKPVIEARVVRE